MSLASMVGEGEDTKQWKDFGLDSRLLHGLKSMKFKQPTLIQESVIPLALAGKDILARAGTGSGKTAAYSLPMCHKLLTTATKAKGVRGLVLVPSKELCNQVVEHYRAVLKHSGGALGVVDLSKEGAVAGKCEICVGTPSTVLQRAKDKEVDLSHVEVCVTDEADALLSHPVVRRIRCMYPSLAQSFLMSATLSPGVLELKRLILNKPMIVKLEEEDDDSEEEQPERPANTLPNIKQYYVVTTTESERYCSLYGLVRFGHVAGKVLLFVDTVDKAYKLKLFLEKFGLRAVVLNSNIPLNSRNHIVAQFNMGEYSYLIATEESMTKAKATDAEYNMSRGIDFREVSAVVNFDIAGNLEEEACKAYIHRIGRTGRGGREGTAISFINKKTDSEWLEYLNEYLSTKGQEVVPHEIMKEGHEVFRLQYRTDDALNSIKKRAIKEAKAKELVQEAMASEKLKKFFSENPQELAALKHLAPVTTKEAEAAASRAYIPEYMDTSIKGKMEEAPVQQAHEDTEDSDDNNQQRTKRMLKRRVKRKQDPLTSLKLAEEGEAEAPVKKRKVIKKKKLVKKI